MPYFYCFTCHTVTLRPCFRPLAAATTLVFIRFSNMYTLWRHRAMFAPSACAWIKSYTHPRVCACCVLMDQRYLCEQVNKLYGRTQIPWTYRKKPKLSEDSFKCTICLRELLSSARLFFKMVPVKRPVAKISVRQRESFAGAISELGKYWNFVVWHA